MPDLMTAPVELAGEKLDLVFALELCGIVQHAKARLLHYVCEACRTENVRGRDEWVSSDFPDDVDSQESIDRAQIAFDEVKAHVRAHEIIGAWAAKILEAQHARK